MNGLRRIFGFEILRLIHGGIMEIMEINKLKVRVFQYLKVNFIDLISIIYFFFPVLVFAV